jgi:hypothetical protein
MMCVVYSSYHELLNVEQQLTVDKVMFCWCYLVVLFILLVMCGEEVMGCPSTNFSSQHSTSKINNATRSCLWTPPAKHDLIYRQALFHIQQCKITINYIHHNLILLHLLSHIFMFLVPSVQCNKMILISNGEVLI